MTRILLAICAVVFAMAQPLLAADMSRPIYKAPAMGPVMFNWTGGYVGINGGYGWARSDWSSVVSTGSTSPRGGLVGGTLGYNLQAGALVWGIEGDFDASWLKGTDTTGTGVCAGVGCETRNSWLATARGRLGYAMGSAMPYFTGGAAFGDIKMTPAGGTSERTTKTGWALGGGFEYAFSGPWSAKVEYLHADLGRATCSAATCGVATDVNFRADIVRAGINYRF
ncbi:MAG TPA: outer membrane protein [Pseudolabrys sp.]|nr:outer membrane protein [Pseudolabrys sp.]